jgi:hypothetical protein
LDFKPTTPYLLRHWRGELSLPVSYWVNGVVVSNLVPVVAAGVLAGLEAEGSISLRLLCAVNLALAVLFFAAQAWGVTGILRAGSRYVDRGGSLLWAAAAYGMVGMTLIALLVHAARLHLPTRYAELWRLARGHDTMQPVRTELADGGRVLLLTGELGSRSAERVRAALDGAPSVKVIHLASPGGRLFEAKAIAAEIRRRGLDTFADGGCASACTIVFLAGRDRGATPESRLGFHRASFVGLQDAIDNDDMLAIYRAAGLSPAFVERVNATAPSELWYPSRDELVSNHVITRVSLGEETMALAIAGIRSQADLAAAMLRVPMWRTVEHRYPGTIARAGAAGWGVKQHGGTDAEAMNAMRAVLTALVPSALRTAPDDILDRFNALTVSELAQALAISPEACGAFLDGKLDTVSSFPQRLVERDLALTAALFDAAPRTDAPVPRARALPALRVAFERLGADYRPVVSSPERYRDRPRLRCDSLLAFQQAVAILPPPQRHDALRAMYQMNAE